jgi:hypothetical protein
MSEFTSSGGSKTAIQEGARSEPGNGAPNWRQSKWLAVGELVVVALIFVADARHLIPFSKTPFLLLFGWISLCVRKIGWRSVGLKLYRNWKTSIALGLAAGVLLEALELFVTQPLLVKWLGKQPDLEVFSCAAWKSQVDSDRSCGSLDTRGVRRGNGLPWLSHEPGCGPAQSHPNCVDRKPICGSHRVWARPRLPGIDRHN